MVLATLRTEPPKLPKPTTPKGMRVDVRQTIGHLRSLKAGEADLRIDPHGAQASGHRAEVRLAAIPKDGGSRSSSLPELALARYTDIGSGKFSDVYVRMRWSDVAPTLTTGCTDITRGRFAHPDDDRHHRARGGAAADLPPDYEFSATARHPGAIGNAVPVKLVEAPAPTFRRALAEIAR